MSDVVLSRRGFLIGALGTGAVLSLGLQTRAIAGTPKEADNAFAPNVWMRLETDGSLHLTCNRSEMGQGVRSSIPLLLAMELGADLSRIHIVQADGDRAYGDQNTDGSRSIRNQYDMLRRMAAVGRTVLERAGASALKVRPTEVHCENHKVIHGRSGREIGFGELTARAARLPIPSPDSVELRAELPKEGWNPGLADAHDLVTGKALYGADKRVEGMLTAIVVRPPVLSAAVKSSNMQEVEARPGVVKVVALPSLELPAVFKPLGGIAVIAKDTWTAKRAADALKIEWSATELDSADWSADIEASKKKVQTAGTPRRVVGDAAKALGKAAETLEATYVVPHLSHAALEPPAALADAKEDSCEVWACVQTPQRARELVANALGLSLDKVSVHVTFLGAAFGRKSKPDFAVEAALLSKAVGRPVRVQWMREDAMRNGYVHASSVQHLRAGLDAAGKLTAWQQRIASPPIGYTFNKDADEIDARTLCQGIADVPMAVENISVETHPVPGRTRIGWMRSVYNINHAFAFQSFLDEIARHRNVAMPDLVKEILGPKRQLTEREAGIAIANYGAPLDTVPIEVARYHRVIDRVRAMSKFDSARASGRGLGFAVHQSFLSYVAAVVEVSESKLGGPRIEKAWIAADAGTIVNQDRVRAQLEGAVLFGASIALYGQLSMKGGRIQEGNFWDYRLVRMNEAPREIEVEIITEGEAPGGIGEPGVPPIAPAIANAWFDLSGERVRELPFHPKGRARAARS